MLQHNVRELLIESADALSTGCSLVTAVGEYANARRLDLQDKNGSRSCRPYKHMQDCRRLGRERVHEFGCQNTGLIDFGNCLAHSLVSYNVRCVPQPTKCPRRIRNIRGHGDTDELAVY